MPPRQLQAGRTRAAKRFMVEESLYGGLGKRQAMYRLVVIQGSDNPALSGNSYQITEKIIEHHIINHDSRHNRRIQAEPMQHRTQHIGT